jgi:hypothetical protein
LRWLNVLTCLKAKGIKKACPRISRYFGNYPLRIS